MKILPVEKQIEVLSEAINWIEKERTSKVCITVSILLEHRGYQKLIHHNDIDEFIPSVTRANAYILAEKYKFEYPGLEAFWWPSGDKINRIKFLNALIEELTKKSIIFNNLTGAS